MRHLFGYMPAFVDETVEKVLAGFYQDVFARSPFKRRERKRGRKEATQPFLSVKVQRGVCPVFKER